MIIQKFSAFYFLISLLIILLFVSQNHAKAINATSCSQSDVTAAFTQSSNGDTILIPQGDCSISNQWSSYLIVNKQVTIKGAGIGKSIIGISLATAGFHILNDNVRITGITFDGRHKNSDVNGLIVVGDDNANPTGITRDFRIDNNRFINCNDSTWPSGGNTGWSVIRVRGFSYGVIDHNIFEDATGEVIDICADGPPNGTSRSLDFGQYINGTVYIEDNTWNYVHESENAIDGNSASRWVFRYNTINVASTARINGVVSDHETCANCACSRSHGDAGSVLMEIYGNKIYNDRTNYGATYIVCQRGGRSLIYNNTIYNADTYFDYVVRLSNYRSFDYGNCGNAAHGRGYSQWSHDEDSGYVSEGRLIKKTTISANIGINDSIIAIANVADFPTYGGSIVIGNEQIDYQGISNNNLIGCKRGANGSLKAAHSIGTNLDLLLFGQCLEQPNNTYVWGNKTVGNIDKNGVSVYTNGANGIHNDYSSYDIKSYAERPDNWQYRNDGTAYPYQPFPYPHPLVSGKINSVILQMGKVPSDIVIHIFQDPKNAKTTISYNLIHAGRVKISLYSINGTLVKVILNEYKIPGGYSISWNTTSLSNGFYILGMTLNKSMKTMKYIAPK